MPALYVDAKRVYSLTPDLQELIAVAHRCAVDPRIIETFEAVVIRPTFADGWYVFGSADFLKRCATFSSLRIHTSQYLQTIFDMRAATRARVLAEGNAPGALAGKGAVVLADDILIGVWIGEPDRPRGSRSARDKQRGMREDPRGELQGNARQYQLRSWVVEEEVIAPPCPPPPADVKFCRTPHLVSSVDVCPALGETFDIDVFCDIAQPKAGESSDSIEIVAPETQDVFDIEVFLSPRVGLRVRGDASKRFKARRSSAESEHARFELVVEQTPTTPDVEINAYFFHDGRPCGRVSRRLPTAAGFDRSTSEGRIKVEAASVPADLVVSVTRQCGSIASYYVKLSSPHLSAAQVGEPCTWDMGEPSRQYVESFFNEFIAPDSAATNRLAALRGAGAELFDAAPRNFKDVYQLLVDRKALKTILVVSDEPYVPWELMVPPTTREQTANGIQRNPIGVDHAIGRWITDANFAPGARLRLERAVVIAPDYRLNDAGLRPLANSVLESDYLKQRFSAAVLSPTSYKSITQAMSALPPDLFHFIGHGNSASDSASPCLHLEGSDTLTPVAVRGAAAFQQAFALRTPVVFLNACEVGQQTLAFGGPAGFVPTLIKLYASSVIAPLWSVSDAVAHEVARRIYTEAVPDTGPPVPVAEILRRIREQAYLGKTAGEDTYAAYCFYGDPNFVIEYAPAQRHVATGTEPAEPLPHREDATNLATQPQVPE
jgi:hypothetical protein